MLDQGEAQTSAQDSDRLKIAYGLRERDSTVLHLLVDRFQSRLIRYLIYLLGRRDGVDDLVQETWLRRPADQDPDLSPLDGIFQDRIGTGEGVPPHTPHTYQVIQGALPPFQSSSRCCLSRKVSIACQKPWWKNAWTSPRATSFSIGSRSNIWPSSVTAPIASG